MKRLIFAFVGLILLIIVIALAVSSYSMYKAAQQKEKTLALDSGYQQTRQAVLGGETPDAAVAAANQLVTLANATGTKNDIADAQILLAGALFARNQNDDQQNASNILKSIITDPDVTSAQAKANAYQHMAEWFYATQNSDLMKSIVFNTPPFGGYLAQANGDVPTATIQLYQMSVSLYPNFSAYYEMAAEQAFVLSVQKIDPANKNQAATVNSIYLNVLSGDALANAASSTEPLTVVFTGLARTQALVMVTRYSKKYPNSLVYDSFDKTIASADKAPENGPILYYGLLARLDYAIVLSAREDGLQDTKIKALLSVVSESNSSRLDSLLTSTAGADAATDPVSATFRSSILQLVHTTPFPEFSDYLVRLGWHL